MGIKQKTIQATACPNAGSPHGREALGRTSPWSTTNRAGTPGAENSNLIRVAAGSFLPEASRLSLTLAQLYRARRHSSISKSVACAELFFWDAKISAVPQLLSASKQQNG